MMKKITNWITSKDSEGSKWQIQHDKYNTAARGSDYYNKHSKWCMQK